MVRVFKWLIEHTPDAQFVYAPWADFPGWLSSEFERVRPGFLRGAFDAAARLSSEGSADELGSFIEATLMSDDGFRNLHNVTHGTVGAYERIHFGSDDPELQDANMALLQTAPHNEHFWGLHGWIDEVFARWQTNHQETPDQTPVSPHHSGHVELMSESFGPEAIASAEEQARLFPTIADWNPERGV